MAEDAYIEVTGYGSATTTPDRARIYVAAVAKAPAVGDAFAAADSGLKAMLEAARDRGVADEDLRSTQVDIRAGRRGRARGAGPGFRAAMGLEITVRDIADAGGVLAAVVDAGGDTSRVQRMSLVAAAPEEALAEARAGAWANALDRARQYARLSGRDLGAVLRVSETRQVHRFMGEQAAVADADSVSVEPGSQAVVAGIIVRWALV